MTSLRLLFLFSIFLLSACSGGYVPETPKIATGSTISTIAPKCEKQAEIKILMYHYVRDNGEDASGSTVYRLSLPPNEFAGQMKQLALWRDAGNGVLATMRDIERFASGSCYPAKHIIVPTDDDGWEEVYSNMFPVFSYNKIPFSLSIISDKVATGSTRISWYIDENEIRTILASGFVDILSHSVDHADFSTLSETGTLREICDSRQSLESRFSLPINTFVFPAGHTDKYALPALRSCGYRYALTTRPGDTDSEKLTTDPYALTRVRVSRGANFWKLLQFRD